MPAHNPPFPLALPFFQVALDSMIENLSPVRVIGVITADELLSHKNPVLRATVSRLGRGEEERQLARKKEIVGTRNNNLLRRLFLDLSL